MTRARSGCVSDGVRVLSVPGFIPGDSPDKDKAGAEGEGGGSSVPVCDTSQRLL